jgi:hypothetical protein
MYLTQQMFLALSEEFVREFPAVGDDLSESIGVELPDKAGEIVVLEVIGQQVSSELRRSPYHESGVVFSPRDNVISGGIVHQLISLGQKGRWHGFVRLHGQ